MRGVAQCIERALAPASKPALESKMETRVLVRRSPTSETRTSPELGFRRIRESYPDGLRRGFGERRSQHNGGGGLKGGEHGVRAPLSECGTTGWTAFATRPSRRWQAVVVRVGGVEGRRIEGGAARQLAAGCRWRGRGRGRGEDEDEDNGDASVWRLVWVKSTGGGRTWAARRGGGAAARSSVR